MSKKYDFGGWATVSNVRCSDGRVIMPDAFKHNDGQTVPLVWNHNHGDMFDIIGNATLEHHDKGVYAYCSLNDSDMGLHARRLVQHGDLTALSIYANQLRESNKREVYHGTIREVSLVAAGANPGAYIDAYDIAHSDDSEFEATIYSDEVLELAHADDTDSTSEAKEEPKKEEKEVDNEKTVQDVIDTMNEDQKTVLYGLIGQALGEGGNDNSNEDQEGEDSNMKHNVFDAESEGMVLQHSAEDFREAIADAKKYGSMKEAFIAHGMDDVENFLAHSNDPAAPYGIYDIDALFPEFRNLGNMPPEFIKRDMDWVKKVMSAVHHTPFSRVKSMFADITEDEARAKGYIKGKYKKEEVFSLLKRSTTPQTVYKKQKLDRDDVIDITDFDVIAWIKAEMRMMLDEEIARAILIGDGRLTSDDDHISHDHIRPVLHEADLFNVKWEVNQGGTDDANAREFIRAAKKSRKEYKGSGQPTLYTTEDVLTDLLLIEDKNGRVIYDTEEKLRTALRVKEIVTVPVMEGLTLNEKPVLGIIVNLTDYNVGADKGGAINMFDDFDIDYNQMKYLIETRCSGAMVKPFAAITLVGGTQTKSLFPGMTQAMAPYRIENGEYLASKSEVNE